MVPHLEQIGQSVWDVAPHEGVNSRKLSQVEEAAVVLESLAGYVSTTYQPSERVRTVAEL
jgi:hypothetical protein